MHARVVHEDGVGFCVIAESILHAQAQHSVAEPHLTGKEEKPIHLSQVANLRLKRQKGENVTLEIHSRGYFGEDQPGRPKFEHAALGDIRDVLSPIVGNLGAECDLTHVFDELAEAALLFDYQDSVLDHRVQTAAGERSQEHNVVGSLGQVDRPTTPCQTITKPTHVHIARSVTLGHSEEDCVQTAAVDEIECRGVVKHRLVVHRSPKAESVERYSADDTGVHGKGDQILDSLVSGHPPD